MTEFRPATQDSRAARLLMGGGAVIVALVMLALPLAAVLAEALRRGAGVALAAIIEPDTLAAIRLSMMVAGLVVPINLIGGLAASWCIAKHDFPGRRLLVVLIELPFAVSPVIAGLTFVLIFGAQGWIGHWLRARDIEVIFALPGLVLATLFVTFPFVARTVLPLMQAQGREAEQVAATLGADGWQTFRRVTLPSVKWALLSGVLLCSARAMGEFGAVAVVSGHIRGETNTMPLHVEILYNEYQFAGAFAVAALLALLGVLTLAAKAMLERFGADAATLRAEEKP
jgi:sulfate transport system permease protein